MRLSSAFCVLSSKLASEAPGFWVRQQSHSSGFLGHHSCPGVLEADAASLRLPATVG